VRGTGGATLGAGEMCMVESVEGRGEATRSWGGGGGAASRGEASMVGRGEARMC
jgi:hypothetical protein